MRKVNPSLVPLRLTPLALRRRYGDAYAVSSGDETHYSHDNTIGVKSLNFNESKLFRGGVIHLVLAI